MWVGPRKGGGGGRERGWVGAIKAQKNRPCKSLRVGKYITAGARGLLLHTWLRPCPHAPPIHFDDVDYGSSLVKKKGGHRAGKAALRDKMSQEEY